MLLIQRISRRAHGADNVALGFAAFAQRFAQAADMNIDGADFDVAIMPPYAVEKTLARKDVAWIFEKMFEQPVFGGAKRDRPAAAFQFNLRYDHLDLNDGIITGGRQNGYMASLIWMPADNIRFMINYAKLFYTDAAIAAGAARDYSVNVVGARARISF